MSDVPRDARPASVAVKEAADVVMARWRERALGGGEVADARVLRCLGALDAMAVELEEIEGRPIHCGTKFPALAAAFPGPGCCAPAGCPLGTNPAGRASTNSCTFFHLPSALSE